MNFKHLNRYIALAIFVLTLIMYRMTAQSSVAFWDCGEYAATSPALEVPHPPGAPLFTLVGRIAMMTPYVSDPALRLNLVSALASALTIMLLYLISVRVISRWKGFPINVRSAIIVFGSAAIGAFTYSVSDTFWFNAVESGLFASSIFFVSLVIWLGMVWFEKSDEPGSQKYLMLAAYVMGLSIGIHQLSLLGFFTIALLIYFKYYEFEWGTFIKFGILTALAFMIIYPGIIKWIPAILNGDLKTGPFDIKHSFIIQIIPPAIVIAAIYGVYKAQKTKHWILSTSLMAGLLIILGYSTYTLVFVRANAHPPINENNPSNLKRLVGYLNRDQYGEQPILWPRRWSTEPQYQADYNKYSSDWDYFWSYQVNHMYLRYLGWNFIGRAGDIQDAPVALFNAPKGWYDGRTGFPTRFFAIPFLLALFGLWYHFKNDWKFGLAFLTMFIVMGFALAVYFNMADPQPRERDYFFVGSFFVFAMWVGVGVSGIIDYVGNKIKKDTYRTAMIGTIIALLFIASPLNMFAQNLYSHNRHGNFAPWDVSYDILQSCKKNAILFTGGDNDTFPLWYLQEGLGIRTDVRIVCLSLTNADWYLLQLKNETPHGALKLPITFSNEEIKNIVSTGPVQWHTQTFKLSVPKEVYKEFSITDTSITDEGYIQYTMNSTLGAGDIRGIRVQDIIVKNIVDTNKWQRPIYFAVTVSPRDFIGLQDYCERQGLAYELTPSSHNGPYYDAINVSIMRQCLFNKDEKYYTDRRYGFKYENLNKPSIYYDSNTRGLISTIRDTFMTLAYYYQAHSDSEDCIATLDTMELKIPTEVIPIDYPILEGITRLYYMAGAKSQFEKYSSIVEREALNDIKENPRDIRSPYNPYAVLLDVYDMRHDYNSSLKLLEQLNTMFPNQKGILDRIAQLNSMIQNR